ncbi:hypothetical protein ACJ41O_007464 [Fusarium nematophilum]
MASQSLSSASETIDPTSESQQIDKVPHWRLILDQAGVTRSIAEYAYSGDGTDESPFVVEFLPCDLRNPLEFSRLKKWTITLLQAIATLAVTFSSSAYSGGVAEVVRYFDVSREVATLGISLFVLGFAIGPLLWAPLSELYGRQAVFFGTYLAMTIFNAVAADATSIAALLVFRFFAGAFGSSCLTNAGGVIADLFNASERGMATSLFAMAPFLGPTIGPIVGGFLGQSGGWRWLNGLMAIFTGCLWIAIVLVVPETYAPVLLRQRASALSKRTDKPYISRLDVGRPPTTVGTQFKIALSRPWILLFREPIVLLASLYMAIIYGTLYMCFAAFPIVFQIGRGWGPGVGGLSFIGVSVGVLLATAGALYDNKRYALIVSKSKGGIAAPEARLPPALVGAVLVPIGLFWYAWTTYPSIHWVVPIIGSAFFAGGLVLVTISLTNYLIDSYVVFAASVLAASSVIRSLFGAAFPLFTTRMYENLGNQWAASIPAFLSLACLPFPFVFYMYGEKIRSRCKYASEAEEILRQIQESNANGA